MMTTPDSDFESRVLRFEQAWQLRGPGAIDEVLGGPERSQLLVELISIDLEFRWKASDSAQPLGLEDYLAHFPELGTLDALPLELIGEEYRARWRWGDRPSHAAFLSRFRERHGPIGDVLRRIDEELEAESTPPSPAPPPVSQDPPAGVPLLSHRDVLLRRLIGAGRMGKVYEAGRRGEGRDVAVKFLRKALLHRPEAVRRFLGEARTIAGLRHPNIVGTEGLGRTDGGSYFIVMDLVRGPNLAMIAGQRAIGVDEAVHWMMETCQALQHAHACGIVHCDLKPANLLLDECGSVRVTDFGLARSLAGDTPGAADVEGTAPFMAPEQAARCWGPIDPRTDVYGIGAVLFALLTGRPPVAGRRLPDILAEVVAATPIVSPALLRPDLPGSVVEICRRCLAKPSDERFADVREVGRALAALGDP